MERIRQLLANLSTLGAEELDELASLLNSTFDEVSATPDAEASADTLAQMQELIDGMEALHTENETRSTQAAERAAALADIKARADALRNPPAEAEAPEGEQAATEGAEETDEEKRARETQAQAEAEQAGEGGETPASPLIGEPAAVAASAGAPGRGAVSRGIIPRMAEVQGGAAPSPEQSAMDRWGATIVAAAGLPHKVPGDPFDNKMDLAKAMSEKLQRLQTSRDHSAALVASVEWTYPQDRILGNDAQTNTEIIDAVCNPMAARYDASGALVATGGVCLPVNVDYSVPTWSTADRPLRDGLPGFQATRGGIRFVTPPDIGVPSLQATASGAGTSVGVWTEATDANPAGATKPVWVVACGTEQLVYVNAIPTRVQFGNMESRFAPEQVAANTQQAIAITAREAELELLTLLANNTKQIDPAKYLGATRDILATVDLLREQYVYSHRIPRNAAFTAVFPEWAKGVIRADMVREQAHDNAGSQNAMAITDAQIEDWFSARGVNLIWTLDGLKAGTYGTGGSAITNQFFPLATAAAAPQWPGQTSNGSFQLVWFFYVEGSFQFLDGGRLDLGVVRDSLLDATNDYETFTETFEGLAFRGVEAYQVQQTILPTGASGAPLAVSNYAE